MKRLLASIVIALSASASLPAIAEVSPLPTSSSSTQTSAVLNKVNLNTADAETLQRELSGIGAVKAQAIVNYREQHGSFASIDELLEVKGVGEALFEKNREKLSVN